MHSELIIVPVMFAAIFGVFYLYLSTRNKERLALIEKGADASIFMGGKRHQAPIRKVLTLNLSLLLIGIGVGAFLALLLDEYTTLDNDGIYPASIFLMAGIGLFISYNMTRKMEDN